MMRSRGGFFSFMAVPIVLVLLGACIFAIAKVRIEIRSLRYEIGSMEKQKQEALTERRDLERKLQELTGIAKAAERKLNLVYPDRQQVVYVLRSAQDLPTAASYTWQ